MATPPNAALGKHQFVVLDNPNDPKQRALFEQAYAIYDKVFPDGEKDSKDSLLSHMGEKNGKKAPLIVAVNRETGKVDGGTVVTAFKDMPAGTVGFHFVDENARRQGLGSALQDEAVKLIRAYSLNETGAPRPQHSVYADIENPARMGVKDIVDGTLAAGLNPFERQQFWMKQGFIPVVSSKTGERFPYTLISDSDGPAEVNENLDLWVKTPGREPGTPINSKEATKHVAFWLYGSTSFNSAEYRAPFNSPELQGMLNWHEQNPQVVQSQAYLDKMLGTEQAFRNILASIAYHNLNNEALGEQLRVGKIGITEALTKHRVEFESVRPATWARAEIAWENSVKRHMDAPAPDQRAVAPGAGQKTAAAELDGDFERA